LVATTSGIYDQFRKYCMVMNGAWNYLLLHTVAHSHCRFT